MFPIVHLLVDSFLIITYFQILFPNLLKSFPTMKPYTFVTVFVQFLLGIFSRNWHRVKPWFIMIYNTHVHGPIQ